MRTTKYFIILALVTTFMQATSWFWMAGPVAAQTGVNIHIGADGVDIRPDAFVSYYQAPPERVTWLQQEKIPTEQWPLVFEIARAGNVTLDRVWDVRQQSRNWYDVLQSLNVPPSYFYYEIPANQRLSPPYGRAYGYYRSHPSEIVRWSDRDLMRLASVKYISDSTHRPAHEAVVIYQKDPHFIRTHEVVVVDKNHGQGRGHEQGHGHGHAEGQAKGKDHDKSNHGHGNQGNNGHHGK